MAQIHDEHNVIEIEVTDEMKVENVANVIVELVDLIIDDTKQNDNPKDETITGKTTQTKRTFVTGTNPSDNNPKEKLNNESTDPHDNQSIDNQEKCSIIDKRIEELIEELVDDRSIESQSMLPIKDNLQSHPVLSQSDPEFEAKFSSNGSLFGFNIISKSKEHCEGLQNAEIELFSH